MRIAGKAAGKLGIMLIIQTFLYLCLSNESRGRDDDVTHLGCTHDFLPIERAVLVSPQPGHVRLRQTFRNPRILNLGDVKSTTISEVEICGRDRNSE